MTDAPSQAHAASQDGLDRGRLDIRRAPGLASLELHEGSALEHSYPRHWHDELFVTAITGGGGVFQWGRSEHRATAGTLVLIAPGEVHSHAAAPGGRSFRSLHAGTPLVADLLPEIPPPARTEGLRSAAIRDARLLRKFLALHRLLATDSNPLRVESRLLEFLSALVRGLPSADDQPPASGPERAAVRRAREFLDDPGSARASLRELAKRAGLSPFHFHRLFRRHVGMPPHEYQLRRRILRARALLAEGRLAADVAAATGFADQSHLTRHFKRLLGIPPAGYSRRARRVRQSKNVQDELGRLP
jgi:AraC-like DNA-binding protein